MGTMLIIDGRDGGGDAAATGQWPRCINSGLVGRSLYYRCCLEPGVKPAAGAPSKFADRVNVHSGAGELQAVNKKGGRQ